MMLSIIKKLPLLTLLFCVSVNHVVAKTKVNTFKQKVASMVASPNSCTIKVDQEVCEMSFHILWQSPQKGDYCLHNKNGVKPLKCWYNVDHGTIKIDYFTHLIEEKQQYILLDAQGDRLIALVDVPIIGTLKQRQRAQRRRRGFWRMF